MTNVPFIRWIASAILFVLMSSGIVDPAQEEEILRMLEVGISGVVLIIYSVYEVVHLYKKTHPHPTTTINTEPGIFQKLIVRLADRLLEPKKADAPPVSQQ
jgi:F420-0:gamma-glutamyl ligase-like protein